MTRLDLMRYSAATLAECLVILLTLGFVRPLWGLHSDHKAIRRVIARRREG